MSLPDEYVVRATDEGLVPLRELCNQLPKRPAPATLWRWVRKPSYGVILPSVKVAGQFCSTKEALDWYFAKKTENELKHREALLNPPQVDDVTDDELRAVGLL